jgi:outer membrane receptor protein involved in Fe transport
VRNLLFIAFCLFIATGRANSQPAADSIISEQTEQVQLIKETSDSLVYFNPYEIVITAPRLSLPVKKTPLAVTVVGDNVLRAMPRTIAVDEPLKLVPGVKVDNQADGERVHASIRGQGILSEHGLRGIKAILDGLPLNDPTGFTPDLYDVDWATVEKIEVLRGLASSLHGGSAAAGVLNILTNNSRNSPLNGDISTTHNFWKLLGQLGARVDKVDYRISLSRMMGDGYRIHTNYYANNFYGKLRWQPTDEIMVIPIIGYTDFFNQNAEGLNLQQVKTNPRLANPDAEPMNEFMKTSRFTIGATAHFRFDKKHEIVSNVFTRRTKYIEAVPKSVLH